ncbi:hypothetical protein WICMUC_004564 [Wickerhamomyces mucosus]|uniref:Structural protein MDM1 n=1 Tax=Wickerhamomyces mucosus TaxID=1378264 RepID=A0A9P8TAF1_9ASCO|nr:hypothetical protein WICMUC_004564 [Wickerhamomyces mucosus]
MSDLDHNPITRDSQTLAVDQHDLNKQDIDNNNDNKISFRFFGYVLLFIFVIKFIFPFIIHILLIIVVIIILLLISILKISSPTKDTSHIRNKFPRFKFTKVDEWNNELDRIKKSQIYNQPEVSEFNNSCDKLIDFIIKDFVQSWFQSISSDQSFPNEIKLQIKSIINQLEIRVSKIDATKLLIFDLLPLFTKHFQTFVNAEESIVGENNLSGSIDLDLKIAKEYDINRKLHRNISLKSNDIESQLRKYSREIIGKVLNYLLPPDEDSQLLTILIREILSQTILSSVFQMLTDPDYWNQLIIKFASSTLNDRDQVRAFRQIIDQQYNDNTIKNGNVDIDNHYYKPQMIFQNNKYFIENKISPSMKQIQFEKYIKRIDRCKSLPILKQLKYFVSVQISRTHKIQSDNEKFKKYCTRLSIAKDIIDNRIIDLDRDSVLIGNSDPNKRNSKMFSKPDLDSFITDLTLDQILSNPSSLSFFMEFMEQRSRTVLLQFWLTVNSIKDPLEDALNPDYEEELTASTELGDVDDIRQIFNQFFNEKLLRIPNGLYKEVESFVKKEDIDLGTYLRARKLILVLQLEVLKRMKERDLSDFKNSDLFLKLLASESFENSLVNKVDPITNFPTLNESKNDINRSDNDINVLENALADIVSNTPPRKLFTNSSDIMSGTDHLKNEIFGNEEDGFLENKPLFDDEDTLNIYDSGESDDGVEEADDEYNKRELNSITMKNDLDVKEQISIITNDLEKLIKQSEMLDPLILKAELTDNSNELRLLRKSKSSYQKEIESKDLLKQQLIIQENENSLFGKTTLKINSYVKSNDRNGKEYIIYVIEITKRSVDNPQSSSSWMVGRRFNQFFKLNEILKEDYPEVSKIAFPRKRLNVLKFQQRFFIDERKIQLQNYLQKLLQLPNVCQNKEFRRFLTVNDYNFKDHVLSTSITSLDLDSSENLNLEQLNGFEGSDDTFNNNNNHDTETLEDSLDPEQIEDMRKELNVYKKSEIDSNRPSKSFIKPIIDLFLTLFPFNNNNNWLRGRAIILVLQQIFGSTIENYLKEKIGSLMNNEKMEEIIIQLTDSLWPNGEFRKSNSEIRTMKEKVITRQESRIIFTKLLIELSSKIVGRSSSQLASVKLHGMLQNEILNCNFILEVSDIILNEVFPELK